MALTVILANGDFPTRPSLLDTIRQADHLVCCDGAAIALLDSHIRVPDMVIGDLDSLSPELQQQFAGRLIHEEEQDTNDLSKAFRYCISQDWTSDDVVIMGATGKREDHTLGNIALLFDFIKQAPKLQMWTDFGCFIPLPHPAAVPTRPGEQISIFTADANQPITSRGLAYPLHKLKLERWWNGTLNEALTSEFSLTFPDTSPVLIYKPWPGCDAKVSRQNTPQLPWKHIHFCGAGGVGMAGLAQLALDAGCHVTGSDAEDSRFLALLNKLGANITVGHSSDNLPATAELLVYSSAVPATNPERLAAAERGIPQCSRGQFLARVAPLFRRVVAIAGSHGKTTTTAMLAHIMSCAGAAPGYLVGGVVTGWERSATAGSWDTLITEVDESDRSQEMMLPTLAVILNIDDDHSWAIGGTETLANSFATLAKHSLKTLAWNTPELRSILAEAPALSFLDDAELPEVNICGLHNRKNAAIAIRAAEMLGVQPHQAIAALNTFPGVERRMTLRKSAAGGANLLIEDYAHHTTELKATLQTLTESYPNHQLVVYFQPHRPERIIRYGTQFAELLSSYTAESVIVTPFMAWEENAPEADPADIVHAINAAKPQTARLAPCQPEVLATEINHKLNSTNDKPVVIAVIGAGDIGKIMRFI